MMLPQTRLTLKPETTVHDVIALLDESGVGILPVVDSQEKLLGIVTDGDVRRALLNNALDIQHIVNWNPKRVNHGTPKVEVLRMLRELHLRHMPVVDSEGRLVQLIFLENLVPARKPNRVVIMAGGLGSRLGDLTKDTPKPMLPIRGRPILEHIIDNLRHQGFHDFILCVNYRAEAIMEYFGDGSRFNVEIKYTKESKKLGTAGALSLVAQADLSHTFVVLNADIITNIDFDELLKFHSESKSVATMCIKPDAYEVPFACVRFDDKNNLVDLVEKPKIKNYINAGIYVLEPEVLKLIPHNEFFDMPELFLGLVKNKFSAKVFQFEDYWVDIGLPTDYSRANSLTHEKGPGTH